MRLAVATSASSCKRLTRPPLRTHRKENTLDSHDTGAAIRSSATVLEIQRVLLAVWRPWGVESFQPHTIHACPSLSRSLSCAAEVRTFAALRGNFHVHFPICRIFGEILKRRAAAQKEHTQDLQTQQGERFRTTNKTMSNADSVMNSLLLLETYLQVYIDDFVGLRFNDAQIGQIVSCDHNTSPTDCSPRISLS